MLEIAARILLYELLCYKLKRKKIIAQLSLKKTIEAQRRSNTLTHHRNNAACFFVIKSHYY